MCEYCRESKNIVKMNIAKYIDHAVLKPESTLADLNHGCYIANKYNIASLCVKPCFVPEAFKHSINVSTVIGFPHGGQTMASKIFEIEQALKDGAKELDIALNYGNLMCGFWSDVNHEVKQLVYATKEYCRALNPVVKIIIETSLLSEESIDKVSCIIEDAGADYIKTSTGFNGRGATLKDIEIIKQAVPNMKIKSSGGIKTYQQALEFINAGCDRIGTSATEEILEMGQCAIVDTEQR
jgi:deoxyribose-phosphate aldolase